MPKGIRAGDVVDVRGVRHVVQAYRTPHVFVADGVTIHVDEIDSTDACSDTEHLKALVWVASQPTWRNPGADVARRKLGAALYITPELIDVLIARGYTFSEDGLTPDGRTPAQVVAEILA